MMTRVIKAWFVKRVRVKSVLVTSLWLAVSTEAKRGRDAGVLSKIDH